MKNKIILFILLFVCYQIFSQELVDKFFQKAKDSYTINDYENSYKFINFVLKFYAEKEMPEDVKLFAERIYFDYLKITVAKNNFQKIDEVSLNILTYQAISSIRIVKLLQEAKDNRFAYEKNIEENNKKKFEQSLINKIDEHESTYIKNRSELNENIKNMLSNTNNNISQTKSLISATILIGIIIFIFIILIIICAVYIFNKIINNQKKLFEHSIRSFQSINEILKMPNMILLPKKEVNLLEDKTDLKSDYNFELPKLKNLLEKCQSYSIEIDTVTNRRNCSKNVAELVYKISKNLGCDELESIIYYGAGLVYDIGFLNINQELLSIKHISEKDFAEIKTHTTSGVGLINFIDEEYKSTFKDAVLRHHEFLDGSGYPKGLKAKDIPYIARVIAVAESYISMISARSYRKIHDKETALNNLVKEPGKYDLKIVKALEEIV